MFYDQEIRGKFETYLSVIWAFVLGVVFMIVPALMLSDLFTPPRPPQWARWLLGPLAVWNVVGEGWLLISMMRAVREKQNPLAPLLAISQPRLPRVLRVLRPLVSIWWLLHMLPCVILIFVLALNGSRELMDVVVGSILALVFTWGVSYMAFVYLLLAITAITRNYELILWLWKFRVRWAFVTSLFFTLVEIFHSWVFKF